MKSSAWRGFIRGVGIFLVIAGSVMAFVYPFSHENLASVKQASAVLLSLAVNGPEETAGLGKNAADFISSMRENLGDRQMDEAYVDGVAVLVQFSSVGTNGLVFRLLLVERKELFVRAWNRQVSAETVEAAMAPQLAHYRKWTLGTFITMWSTLGLGAVHI